MNVKIRVNSLLNHWDGEPVHSSLRYASSSFKTRASSLIKVTAKPSSYNSDIPCYFKATDLKEILTPLRPGLELSLDNSISFYAQDPCLGKG